MKILTPPTRIDPNVPHAKAEVATKAANAAAGKAKTDVRTGRCPV